MARFKIPRLVGFLLLCAFIYTIGLLLPYTLVLGKAGLEHPEIANQLSFYVNLINGFGIALILVYSVNYVWKRDGKYGDGIGFFNIGEKPALSYFKRFTGPQLSLLGAIFFASLFLIANLLQFLGEGIFGLKVLPQQFSPIDSLMFSTLLIPTGENLMAGFTIGVLILGLKLFAVRYNLSAESYKVYAYTLVVIGLAVFGFIWHQSVYGGSDVAGTVTAFFWGLGGLISLATGFWILFWEMHLFNNFFIDFGRLYSSDIVLSVTILMILVLSVVYFIVYNGRLLGKKNASED